LIFILCISHSHVQSVDGSTQKFSAINQSTNKTIDLCCRWDQQISDGVLKYKLVNIQGELKDLVREAFDTWNEQLVKLRLVEARPYDQKTEIVITVGDISNGNSNKLARNAEAGLTAGQSVNNLNKDGFITNATILLSDELFDTGSDLNPISDVILHEIGHVLGLGHANFNELMNPVVTGDMEGVSVCDVKGVLKTNELSSEKGTLPPFQSNSDKESTIINCQ
jgi:predicted Zn-dependent protease with MMP-like domain